MTIQIKKKRFIPTKLLGKLTKRENKVGEVQSHEVTGGAAKSIQSINVAAVVAVAAAAAVAGLASPAATHGMNKLHERNKTALFLSFFHFFEQPSLFSPCPCPP